MPITIETDLRGIIIPEEVKLTPISFAGTSPSNCRCSVIGKPGIPGLMGLPAS
jgi:hypothetical protein